VAKRSEKLLWYLGEKEYRNKQNWFHSMIHGVGHRRREVPAFPWAAKCLQVAGTLLCCFILGGSQLALSAEAPIRQFAWQEMEPGVWRSAKMPYSYALKSQNSCLLIGAPPGIGTEPGYLPPGISKCSLLLLTHHHRDSCAALALFPNHKIPVRAPKAAEDYLSPTGVQKYWDVSLPRLTPGEFPPLFHRYWSDWSFLVKARGVKRIDFNLQDGDTFDWAEWKRERWKIKVVATPGHSKDHLAFIAMQPESQRVLCFCGDALSARGKMWSPYTTEWHHQQDEGLLAASQSLRKLGHEKPMVLYPEHGEPIRDRVIEALQETSLRLEEAAQLKNFDVYTKQIVGNPPSYRFLAKEQVGTANPQGNPHPWSRLSPHHYITGNTYALASKDGPVLLVDPYAQNLVTRVEDLKRDYGLGPVDVALISHAHNDHYTGIFALPDRKSFQVWTLDSIAAVVDHPDRFRAVYVDPRTPHVDRQLKAGEVVRWHEYELTIHHQPGQTNYAMGVEVEIDGKHCLFSGDNFYHMDQYSGSGGWSGRNLGLPGGYEATAKAILDMQPDWILAEHGGAFEFNAEDFRRRVDWAHKAGEAADALSPHGSYAFDWNPQRIRLEPIVCHAKPGERIELTLVATNPLKRAWTYRMEQLHGYDRFFPGVCEVVVPPGETMRKQLTLTVPTNTQPGRHVLPMLVRNRADEPDPVDVFVVLEIEPE
jgi:glyoxylase-like metal-dependent hydrolase (beta-lactamase superfamily II)